jgi:hypothetical protein
VREHVDYQEAKRRIIEWWYDMKFNHPIPLHWFADAIWPGHRMRAQGAALASSPIVRKMRDEKLIRLGLSVSECNPGYVVVAERLKEK